jgi:AraC-like DNA-binding protein
LKKIKVVREVIMRTKDIKRPISRVFSFLLYAVSKGIDKKLILEGTQLRDIDFLDLNNELSLKQELLIIRNLMKQSKTPETAWDLGRNFYTKNHSTLEKMVVYAPTAGDIVSCWIDYSPLLNNYFRIIPKISGRLYRLNFINKYSLPADLVPFLIERDMMAGISFLEGRFPGLIKQVNLMISFSHSPRSSHKQYLKNFSRNIKFHQETNFIEVDKGIFCFMLPAANPVKYERYRQQCQVELKLCNKADIFLTDRVKLCLHELPILSTLSDIAKKLNIEERSLAYQLLKEGTRFQKIRNQFVFQQSLSHLRDNRLCIGEISNNLGYSETCAFSRAFKKWMGMSPSRYRKEINLNQ